MLEKMIQAQTAKQAETLDRWLEKREREQVFPKGVCLTADVSYRNDGAACHKMDIYQPEEGPRPHPVLINLHGGGFLLGGLFFLVLDLTLPHLNPINDHHGARGAGLKGTTKLLTAITLHNIPEGMAIGLAFALAAQDSAMMAPAAALALGIGIQNFPEGAAISLPLSQQGYSPGRALLYGSLSGLVEPIGGVLTVLLAGSVTLLMPWLLAFAAGAMIYVTVDELIPDCHIERRSNHGTLGTMLGFLVMMLLDVALG